MYDNWPDVSDVRSSGNKTVAFLSSNGNKLIVVAVLAVSRGAVKTLTLDRQIIATFKVFYMMDVGRSIASPTHDPKNTDDPVPLIESHCLHYFLKRRPSHKHQSLLPRKAISAQFLDCFPPPCPPFPPRDIVNQQNMSLPHVLYLGPTA